ncbi:hypothetical protein BDV12DRAFT_109832 [Aspergillus spectabilis]
MAPPNPNAGSIDINDITTQPLRPASKSERRYITRHSLDFYRSLILGGLYAITLPSSPSPTPSPGEPVNPKDATTYIPALKHCISTHPSLRTAVKDADSESPVFVRPDRMDLRRHLEVVHPEIEGLDGDAGTGEEREMDVLRNVLKQTHNRVFEDVERVPGWMVVVVPLPDRDGGCTEKEGGKMMSVYIIFAYSHTHGDGRSGLNFHWTFLEGLRVGHRIHDCEYIYDTATGSSNLLPPPMEEACELRITWSYLLFTVLGGYVPGFIRRWHGFRTPLATEKTWTGTAMKYDPEDFRTGVGMLIVPQETVEGVLGVCRAKKGVKFTGLLNALVVWALSGALAVHSGSGLEVDEFIGQIVVDLRGLVGAYSPDMMVNCVSAVYEHSSRVSADGAVILKDDPALWDAARDTTLRLADSAGTLVNQPIGLVAYLDKFRPWFLGKLGQKRDSSYEISNAVVFDPSSSVSERKEGMTWEIERMVFSQPANVTNCPLSFSVVTRKDGDMALTLNWQIGVLGVSNEDAFAKDVLGRIDGYLAGIVEM